MNKCNGYPVLDALVWHKSFMDFAYFYPFPVSFVDVGDVMEILSAH